MLTLDYVDVTAGGETKKNVYCYQACQFAFRKNGMAHNPWDSAVQFRDELITKKFPPESGFEATYRFTIEGEVPKPLCHRHRAPRPVHDHLQRQAGRAAQGRVVARQVVRPDRHYGGRQGRARTPSRSRPRRSRSITSWSRPTCWATFALKAADAGFVIVPADAAETGARGTSRACRCTPPGWRIASSSTWRSRRAATACACRHGTAAWPRCVVNGKPAGYIALRPVEVRRDQARHAGGQHDRGHGDRHAQEHARAAPRRRGARHGLAEQFQTAPEAGPPPGKEYHTIGYGLFEPFVLEQVAP